MTAGLRTSKKRRGGLGKPNARGKAVAPSLAALAETYELPSGRWKGCRLARVAERDAEYLRWAADAWDGVAGMTVRTYLSGRAKP